jgi:hypothetical protein
MLVDAEQCVTEKPYNMMERARILVEYWIETEQLLIPGPALFEIGDSHRDMSYRRKFEHCNPQSNRKPTLPSPTIERTGWLQNPAGCRAPMVFTKLLSTVR